MSYIGGKRKSESDTKNNNSASMTKATEERACKSIMHNHGLATHLLIENCALHLTTILTEQFYIRYRCVPVRSNADGVYLCVQ